MGPAFFSGTVWRDGPIAIFRLGRSHDFTWMGNACNPICVSGTPNLASFPVVDAHLQIGQVLPEWGAPILGGDTIHWRFCRRDSTRVLRMAFTPTARQK